MIALLFRWGGDEFMVLMFKLDVNEARRRMQTLNDVLGTNSEQWTSMPVKISVSVGVAGFESMKNLGSAIEQADQAMYSTKAGRARIMTSVSAQSEELERTSASD